MSQGNEGRGEHGHEPEPGYRTIFYVVFGITVLYLAIVMASTL